MDAADVSDDDWFYESIRSYKTLQMYDLQMEPLCMAQSGDKSLVIAGRHPPTGKSEILQIQLPSKLLLPAEEEGRCKGNDFHIITGGIFEGAVKSVRALLGEEKSVASFKEQLGVTILNHGSADSSVITKSQQLLKDSNLLSPSFSVCPTSAQLLATKSNEEPLILVDCTSGCILESSTLPTEISKDSGEIIPRYISSNTCAILHAAIGTVLGIDLRTQKVSFQLCTSDVISDYVMSSDNHNRIGVLSATGDCSIFDIRSAKDPIATASLDFPPCESAALKLELADCDRISVSGFDSSVHVFEMRSSEIVNIFTHHGHTKLDVRAKGNVTDHLWLPHVASNFIVSCAENGTLNCWQYVLR